MARRYDVALNQLSDLWSQGCALDYIGNGGPARMGVVGGDRASEAQQCFNGIPVLFLVIQSRRFERRLLQVDDHYNYLYLLHPQSGQAHPKHAPIVIAIGRILEIVEGFEARLLCRGEAHAALDDTDEVVRNVVYGHDVEHNFVVALRVAEATAPSQELVLFFVAAPKQNLANRLKMIIKAAAEAKRQEFLPSPEGRVAGAIDGIQFVNPSSIFSKGAKALGLAVSFSRREEFLISMPVHSTIRDCDLHLLQLARDKRLSAVDAARLAIVMHESIQLRIWAEYVTNIIGDEWFGAIMDENKAESKPIANRIRESCGDDARIILLHSTS